MYQNWAFFITMGIKSDTQQGFGAVSNTHPTQVDMQYLHTG
jgi:hypothetical protein